MKPGERKGRREGRREGRQEGRQEGLQKGRLATIKRQIEVLTGKLTPALERNLDRLGEAQLAELAEALLRFSSTPDLERWLDEHRA